LTVSGSEHGDNESGSSSSSSSTGGEDEGDPLLGAAGGTLNPNPQQIDAALDVLLNDTLYNAAQQDAAFEALLRGIVRNVTEVEGPPTMLRLEEQHEEQEEQGEGEETDVATVQFDPDVATRHAYLGELDEVPGGYAFLEECSVAHLPLMALEGVVLFPGCQLPLLLRERWELLHLRKAMTAPAPVTRLLAVVPSSHHLLPRGHVVACTAEVRQIKPQEDGSIAVVAYGRQRAEVEVTGHSMVDVAAYILPEGPQGPLPRFISEGAGWVSPTAAKPWDLPALAEAAQAALAQVLLPVSSFQGGPLELSYWISHNLPLDPGIRQQLLEDRIKEPPPGSDEGRHQTRLRRLADLVARCLLTSPAERMTPEAAVEHAFFQSAVAAPQ